MEDKSSNNLTDTPNEYKRGFEDGQKYAEQSIPLEEWMVEFAEWIDNSDQHKHNGKWYSTQELLTEFLKTKNYVQK